MGSSVSSPSPSPSGAVATLTSERSSAWTGSTPAYLLKTFAASANAFDAASNPRGAINLSVAENRLLHEDVILARLAELAEGDTMHTPPSACVYDDPAGNLAFRAALCRRLSSHVFGHGEEVSPKHVVCAAGCTSMLEALTFTIADPGDVFLTPTPWYSGFQIDVGRRAGVQLEPVVRLAEDGYVLSIDALEAAYQRAVSRGQRVRALLLATPDNPMGTMYSAEQLNAMMAWVESKPGCHFISDEIYALSVHDETAKFVSVASLRPPSAGGLGDRVHVLWGASKDLTLSGFRMATLYSENKELLERLQAPLIFAMISGDTQFRLRRLFFDEDTDGFFDSFVAINRRRLRKAYEVTIEGLERLGFKYVPAAAGFFVWIDAGDLLSARTAEEEERLWNLLCDEANILLTPGSACNAPEPGWFRFCFAAVPPEALEVAFSRMQKVLQPKAQL